MTVRVYVGGGGNNDCVWGVGNDCVCRGRCLTTV